MEVRRLSVGDARADLPCNRGADGPTAVDALTIEGRLNVEVDNASSGSAEHSWAVVRMARMGEERMLATEGIRTSPV